MAELIHNFGVDWKLLAAQAVNFFILLFLLAKFAYRPILETLRRRKTEIEKGLRFAKEAEEKLAKADALSEEKLTQTNKQALGIVNAAEARAKAKEKEVIKEAAVKGEEIISAAKRAIKDEQAKIEEEILASSQDLVRSCIVAILGKIPAVERDKELIKDALEELRVAARK